MQPVDTIIFDVGNVLFHWNIRCLYAKLIDDPAELDHFLGNVLTLEWHDQHDAGRLIADMIDELAGAHPRYEALIRLYEPRWLETIPGPVDGMNDLVERLAVSGVPVFGITTFGSDL